MQHEARDAFLKDGANHKMRSDGHAHELAITPKAKPRSVSWKTPLEQLSGQTPDASETCKEHDPSQEQCETLNGCAASLPVVSPETTKLTPKAMMKPPPPVEAGSLHLQLPTCCSQR